MALRRILLFMALTLVAGCVEEHDPPRPAPTSAAAASVILEPNNATSCTRVFPAIPVDRLHAQTFLPDGFVAAEASTFFGQASLPADAGLLIGSAMRCGDSQWSPNGYVEGMLGIFIEPPLVDGRPVEGEHFYELGRATPDSQPYTATMERIGWTLFGNDVDVAHVVTRFESGSMMIKDEAGAVFGANVEAAPAKDDFTGTLHLRWWHQTETGTGFFEYVFAPDGYLGPGTCEARAGSVPAQVMQSTQCRGALFMVGPPYDVDGRFEFRQVEH